MKMFRKLGIVILVVSLLCCMSVGAYATEFDGLVEESFNNSNIKINSATVTPGDGIITVTLSYSILENGTPMTLDGEQLTMLAYVFDVDGESGNDTTVPEEDAAEDIALPEASNGNANSYVRAIDQVEAKAQNDTIVFSMSTGEGTYAVSEQTKLVVRLGSNIEGVGVQAFFVSLEDLSTGDDETTYTVTYKAGEGTGDDVVVSDVEAGDYTLVAVNTFTAPAEKEFDGWLVDGVKKAVGDTITISANTIVTAQWKAISGGGDDSGDDDGDTTYTVTYKAGEGTGDDVVVSDVAAGDYTLAANTFTAPAEKEFDGWLVDGVKKAVGDTITISANTIVTAQWKAISGGDDSGDDVDPADVNNDSRKNAKDAVYLLRNTMNAGKYPINASINRDMNNDGRVNAKDAVYLLRHTMNASKYPLYPGK